MLIQNKLKKYKTLLNLISGILTMLVQLAISFFLSSYIVRTLGETANGFTQLANNFVMYASLITIAFNSMAGRFISVSSHQGKTRQVKIYYSSIVLCNIALCIILLPISGYIIKNLEQLIVIENVDVRDVKILFGCVFLNFFANLMLSLVSIAMFVANMLYYQNFINLIRYLLNGILLLCVFSLFPAKIYYVSLIALCLTIMVYPITRQIQKKLMPELKFSVKEFRITAVKEMLSSGVWNTVNQCGQMLMTGMDLLLSNLFISPSAMGLLSVAKTIPNAIINFATIINNSFAPSITMKFAKGDRDEVLRQLRSNMKISSVLISIPIVTFCSYGNIFYKLWMPTLDSSKLTYLSFLTCMAFIPWAGPQTLYNVFTATNHLRVNSIAFVLSGILNIFIVFVCLKYTNLGVYAVAGTSSLLSIIRNLIVTAPYTAYLLGLHWYEFYKDVWSSMVCAFFNFIVAMGVQNIYHVNRWMPLIASAFFTCVITLLLDMYIVLSKNERKILLERIRKGKAHG